MDTAHGVFLQEQSSFEERIFQRLKPVGCNLVETYLAHFKSEVIELPPDVFAGLLLDTIGRQIIDEAEESIEMELPGRGFVLSDGFRQRLNMRIEKRIKQHLIPNVKFKVAAEGESIVPP